jgi:hypothetical protein
MDRLLGITGPEAAAVAIASAVVYAVSLAILRLMGAEPARSCAPRTSRCWSSGPSSAAP